MALESVVYPQETFGYGCKQEFYNLTSSGGGLSGWVYEDWCSEEENKEIFGILNNNNSTIFTEELQGLHGNWGSPSHNSSVMQGFKDVCSSWDPNNSSPKDVACTDGGADHHQVVLGEEGPAVMETQPPSGGKRKRRRTRSCKNKEELENQRITHITVERNRRKQMNEYLSVIRSLMPFSYVQRGDQASIIGGAINFVKELEQHLQTLEAQKKNCNSTTTQQSNNNGHSPSLFADFFTSPQYSTRPNPPNISPAMTTEVGTAEKRTTLTDIQVMVIESHANLKILVQRRPRQLLKIVSGLQSLWVTILHLNVTTTVDQMVLYSLSIKLEDGCQLSTADEVADAINHLLGRIQEEETLS
uniref:Transcription factor bHLH59 n=1 Tax=Nothapodytes nimmoniana TaxID=159386 RepID=A0A9E9C665_NOTNI|nr:transcription factor bHLH59 [Nothapodytes nimmoniana]